jgi:AraC-like DNA-binding protein/phage gpG-like protein
MKVFNYFVLHAVRQSGKTTFIQDLAIRTGVYFLVCFAMLFVQCSQQPTTDVRKNDTVTAKQRIESIASSDFPLADSLLVQLNELYGEAQQNIDLPLLKQTTRALIRHYRAQNNLREVFLLANEYLETVTENGDSTLMADTYCFVGVTYFTADLASYALDYFLKMFDYPLDPITEAYAYYALGETARSIDKNTGMNPQEYYRKTEEISRRANDTARIADALFGQSQLFFDSMGAYKFAKFSEGMKDSLAQSTRYLEEAVLDLKEDNAVFVAGLCLNYAAMGQYEKAFSFREKIESYRNMPEYNPLTYNCLAAVNIYMKNYDESITLCKQAIDFAQKGGRLIDERNATDILAYSCMGKGDYKSAAEYLLKVKEIEEQLRSNENNVELIAAQVKFDLKQKEMQIREEQQRNRTYRTVLLLTSILAILLATIVLIILLNRRKIALKNRALVQQIKEQIKAAEEREREQEQRNTAELRQVISLPDDTPNDDLFVKFVDLLKENQLYTCPDIDIKKLLLQLGTNEKYLQKSVKESSGMGISEFINTLRLQYSCELLLNPKNNNTVENISYSAGFGSRSAFFRNFRNKYSMSPDEFRRLARK